MSAKWMEASRDDLQKLVSSGMHRACEVTQQNQKAVKCNQGMSKYLFEVADQKKTNAGAFKVFDARKTWNKLVLAARIICAVPNEQDVCVVGKGDIYHRGLLKFAKYIRGSSITGRFSPGTFTNHAQKGFKEPAVIIVANPMEDAQAVREAAHVGIPVIAMCDGDTSLKNIDCAIPCNNKGVQSVGTCMWFLAREVLRLRGEQSRTEDWDIMPDLFFYRSSEEVAKQEEAEALPQVQEEVMPEDTYQGTMEATNWDAQPAAETGPADWAMDGEAKEDGLADWGATAEATPATNNDWGIEAN